MTLIIHALVDIIGDFNIFIVFGFSVLWRCVLGNRNGIWSIKTLHQNPLAMVVDISGWSTGCSTLWQHHLPVNASRGLPTYPGFPYEYEYE